MHETTWPKEGTIRTSELKRNETMSDEMLTALLCVLLLMLVLPDPTLGVGGGLALYLYRKGPSPDAFI
ncbi:hypothetical protein HYV43_02705 [Candidatus Micrarchaeota archaeon]|nr:hypothetical protein [Candidatus Micrarchaeota archaeon]